MNEPTAKRKDDLLQLLHDVVYIIPYKHFVTAARAHTNTPDTYPHISGYSGGTSAYFCAGSCSEFEAYPRHCSRLDSSLLCASIFLSYLIGTLSA
jgi:hypothetical protein